jgi:lipopolysaccharide/colanic/teichoic acid biosynthesis glycosyltransferase
MIKRLFDITVSLLGLIILMTLLMAVYVWVIADSRGGGIYRQWRVGKGGRDFALYKFRTMHPGADKKQLITIGDRDPRITNAGYFLRKFKLDELPQLFNVLKGDMSMVGPRPEVRKYVALYSDKQMKILDIKPGITDYASIAFIRESELLAGADDPERTYQEEILPEKLRLNMQYLNQMSLLTDCKILFQTILKIFSK